MFALSLVDTLRLAFGQVVYHHKTHTDLAASFARKNQALRAAEGVLMLGVLIAALAASFGRGEVFSIVAATLAGTAMMLFILHIVLDYDGTARAHHISSARLWHLREQYRSLLADLKDGTIDQDAARARRDALMRETAAIFETAPALTRSVFPASAGGEEAALAEDAIDRFLPKSLQQPRLESLAPSEGEAR